jgi:hypothetical protein
MVRGRQHGALFSNGDNKIDRGLLLALTCRVYISIIRPFSLSIREVAVRPCAERRRDSDACGQFRTINSEAQSKRFAGPLFNTTPGSLAEGVELRWANAKCKVQKATGPLDGFRHAGMPGSAAGTMRKADSDEPRAGSQRATGAKIVIEVNSTSGINSTLGQIQHRVKFNTAQIQHSSNSTQPPEIWLTVLNNASVECGLQSAE